MNNVRVAYYINEWRVLDEYPCNSVLFIAYVLSCGGASDWASLGIRTERVESVTAIALVI